MRGILEILPKGHCLSHGVGDWNESFNGQCKEETETGNDC